jgi:hypothetical protein
MLKLVEKFSAWWILPSLAVTLHTSWQPLLQQQGPCHKYVVNTVATWTQIKKSDHTHSFSSKELNAETALKVQGTFTQS